MYMQFHLDLEGNKDLPPEGQFNFTKEAQRIQEETSKKEVELFLGKFESEDSYIEERKKIANQYHVLYPENIEFRDNEWYMKGKNETVNEWDELHKKPNDYNPSTHGQW